MSTQNTGGIDRGWRLDFFASREIISYRILAGRVGKVDHKDPFWRALCGPHRSTKCETRREAVLQVEEAIMAERGF